MNVLVITGHPRAQSFCSALAAAYATGAREADCSVRELSLATLCFDPDVHTVSPRDQPLEPDL
ncbi:MAG: NAD(P)H-dependent oxidoreductase, partial [Burkholderiales bacterium]